MGGVEWPGYEAPSRGKARSSRPLAAAMAVIVGLLEEERRAPGRKGGRRRRAHATPSLRLESEPERIAKARSGSIELQKLPRTARRWP
eukprot:COSAG04_NODE_3130_length_3135_cov_6.324440_6_plen_88_part_00